jgi:hypothetical protein
MYYKVSLLNKSGDRPPALQMLFELQFTSKCFELEFLCQSFGHFEVASYINYYCGSASLKWNGMFSRYWYSQLSV